MADNLHYADAVTTILPIINKVERNERTLPELSTKPAIRAMVEPLLAIFGFDNSMPQIFVLDEGARQNAFCKTFERTYGKRHDREVPQ